MKRSTLNLLLATAAVLAASTMASAQTIKADIPFPFRAAGVTMTPGSYELTRFSLSHQLLELRDLNRNKTIVLSAGIPQDAPLAWTTAGRPMLSFTCGDNGCALTRVWTGRGSDAQKFVVPQEKEPVRKHLERVVAAIRSR